MVKLMSAVGIPEEKMVHAILNPETGRGITPETLRKHFRDELDQGLVQADLKAMSNLLRLTETSAGAAIFWAKCRLRWKERDTTSTIQMQASMTTETPQDADKASMHEVARRVAFVLTMGAEEATP